MLAVPEKGRTDLHDLNSRETLIPYRERCQGGGSQWAKGCGLSTEDTPRIWIQCLLFLVDVMGVIMYLV